ncbi:MAG: hypothetical protein QOJ91_1891 [Sphingomonadales bacterium]|jgi:hypothetical protein|nr:hypothetical protein [Sphingomonadales bacterium]
MVSKYFGVAAMAAFAWSAQAPAQNIDSIDSQVDFIRFTAPEGTRAPRRSAIPVDTGLEAVGVGAIVSNQGQEKPKEFTLSIGAPFTYTTNALKTDTGRVDDVHINPTAGLSWEKPLNKVTLSASLQMSYDEYVDLAANDQSVFLGNFSALLGTLGKTPTPYVSYAPSVAYLDFYDHHVVTLHDFTAGARSFFKLREDAKGNPLTSLVVDVAYSRREASLAASEQHRATVTLKFSGVVSPELSWILKPQFQGRFYSAGTNDGRNDYNFKLLAGIEWKLIKSGQPSPYKVAFNIVFERNDSNFAGKDYTAWDIGPSVGYSYKF